MPPCLRRANSLGAIVCRLGRHTRIQLHTTLRYVGSSRRAQSSRPLLSHGASAAVTAELTHLSQTEVLLPAVQPRRMQLSEDSSGVDVPTTLIVCSEWTIDCASVFGLQSPRTNTPTSGGKARRLLTCLQLGSSVTACTHGLDAARQNWENSKCIAIVWCRDAR